MSNPEQFSDEILNALVDGELEAAEEARILDAAASDPELQQRITELRRVKSLVLAAYTNVSPPAGARKRHWVRLPLAVAASIIAFVLGVALTWTLADRAEPPATRTAESDDAAPAGQVRRVLFHVTRDDSRWLSMILQESETLLNGPGAVQVRIVASGEGLALLQKGASPAPERIRSLADAYHDRLVFAGCGVTFKQMLEANPSGVRLLPEVVMVTSGMQDVMQRQSEGWTYLHI